MADRSPTWQSSQWRDATSHLAVDGNDNPDLFAGSCSHTEGYDIIEPPVWAVDLGHLTDVYYVEVVNRNDLEGKHLSNEWHTNTSSQSMRLKRKRPSFIGIGFPIIHIRPSHKRYLGKTVFILRQGPHRVHSDLTKSIMLDVIIYFTRKTILVWLIFPHIFSMSVYINRNYHTVQIFILIKKNDKHSEKQNVLLYEIYWIEP